MSRTQNRSALKRIVGCACRKSNHILMAASAQCVRQPERFAAPARPCWSCPCSIRGRKLEFAAAPRAESIDGAGASSAPPFPKCADEAAAGRPHREVRRRPLRASRRGTRRAFALAPAPVAMDGQGNSAHHSLPGLSSGSAATADGSPIELPWPKRRADGTKD